MLFCMESGISIKAAYLKDKLNTRADALSLFTGDNCYSLPSKNFSCLCSIFLLTPDIDLFASRINTTTDKYFLRPWSPGNRLQPLFPSLAMYCICFPPLLWRWANFYLIILQIHYQMKYQFPHLAHSTIFSRPAWCFISKNVFFQLCYQKGQPSFPDMQGNFWHVLFLQGQKLWKIF